MMENPRDVDDKTAKLAAVMALTKTCDSEYEHVAHVSSLTLRLFDELTELHQLGENDRFLLQCGSILHDIGWVEGWKNHHKTALRIILDTPLLQFNHRDRLIIGSIARYHRKALPDMEHDHYASLDPLDRQRVRVLAAFLRLADGLDKSHCGKIQDLYCKVKTDRITINCVSAFKSAEEHKSGIKKADLLSLVFDREVLIKMTP